MKPDYHILGLCFAVTTMVASGPVSAKALDPLGSLIAESQAAMDQVWRHGPGQVEISGDAVSRESLGDAARPAPPGLRPE